MSSCGNGFLLVATNRPFLSPSTAVPIRIIIVLTGLHVGKHCPYILTCPATRPVFPSNRGLFLLLKLKAPATETPYRPLLRILPPLAALALLPSRLLLSLSLLESLGDTGTPLAGTMCLWGYKNPSLWY